MAKFLQHIACYILSNICAKTSATRGKIWHATVWKFDACDNPVVEIPAFHAVTGKITRGRKQDYLVASKNGKVY